MHLCTLADVVMLALAQDTSAEKVIHPHAYAQ